MLTLLAALLLSQAHVHDPPARTKEAAPAAKASLNDPKDVAATVMFYGPPITDTAKLKTLKGPLLGLWGNQDKGITPDKVAAFDKALTEAGVKHEFHAYDAGHGFANPSSGAYK